MDKTERRQYRNAAKNALARAVYNPKKLVLIYIGAMALLSLIVSIAAFALEQKISGITGLRDLGSRGIWMTAQAVLQMLPPLLMPFWSMGYLFVTVRIARGKQAFPEDLAAGFTCFLPILRLQLIMTLVYALVAFVAVQVGSSVFMLTPWAEPFMNAVFALANEPENATLEAAMSAAAMDAALPMACIVAAVFLAFAMPFFYRYRLAEMQLMEQPQKGALKAMRVSADTMRFKRLDLFRLDLSFWWFYLLDALAAAIGFGNELLKLAGVSLPISEDVSYFVFLVLSLGCQVLLYWWRKNEVSVTYAQFYTDLVPQSKEE